MFISDCGDGFSSSMFSLFLSLSDDCITFQQKFLKSLDGIVLDYRHINIKRYLLISVDFCIVFDYRFSVFSAYQAEKAAKKPAFSPPRNARHGRTLEDKSECKSSDTLRQNKSKSNVWWTPPTVYPPPLPSPCLCQGRPFYLQTHFLLRTIHLFT
jgi:hypothetical protein